MESIPDGHATGGESELTRLIREAGALGTIQLSTFPIRLLFQKVDSWENLPTLPDIKLIDKQYNEIKELVSKGERVVLEFDIRNYFRPGPVKYHNVIGWIPGTQYPDEYVILGGHLDGFDGDQVPLSIMLPELPSQWKLPDSSWQQEEDQNVQ